MKLKKILFIQAMYDSKFSSVLPAGIGYLSQYLSSNDIENDVFDLNVDTNTEENMLSKIREYKPDLVGFSMMSLNYKYNFRKIEKIKQVFPDLKIAVGGAHMSTMRKDVLENCDAIDYGIVLEGEYTLLELMTGEKDVSDISGLIYKKDNDIIYTGDREFIQDLDVLPFPRYEKFNKKDYSTLISLFSSRGCPYHCTYCPVNLAIGRRYITRSTKNIIDELKYHYSQGYREFSFRDDNFTLIQKRVLEICDGIEGLNLKDMFFMCDNGVRADKLNYDILKRMKEVGFKMIGIGVESGVDRILKSLRKSATVKDMENAISIACELGYMVEIFLLIGYPSETWEDFEESVKLATKYPISTVRFYHLLPYPNTEMFDICKKNNYLLRTPEEYLNDGSQRVNTPFLSTPEFPVELRKKAFD